MALTFGAYAAPDLRRILALAAVAGITAVNYLGVRKTAWLTRGIVVVVLASLAAVVVAALGGGAASFERLGPVAAGGVAGILEAAGLLGLGAGIWAIRGGLARRTQSPAV